MITTREAIVIANRISNQMYRDGLEVYAGCEVFDRMVNMILDLSTTTKEKLYECYFTRRQEAQATDWEQYYATGSDDDDHRQ